MFTFPVKKVIPFDRLDRIIDGLGDEYAKEIYRIFRQFMGTVKLAQLEHALRLGNIAAVEAIVDWRTLSANLLNASRPALRKALQEGGQEALRVIPGEMKTAFDVTNPLVASWGTAEGASLVRELTDHSRQGMRTLITRGLAEGVDSRTLGKRLLNMDGFALTARQATSVDNFRASVQSLIRGEISPATLGRSYGLSEGIVTARRVRDAQVDGMVKDYADRWLHFRADTIGRHEMAKAYNQGKKQGWMQASARGSVDRDEAREEWLTSANERVCPICLPMHGQKRKLGEFFDTGDGRKIDGPPAHITCYCTTHLITEPKRGKPKVRERTDARVAELQTDAGVEEIT